MSRHRNVRKLDYSEDYSYDDVYGKSLDDEVAISPNTAAEFMYQRDSRENPSLDSYLESKADSSSEQGMKLKSPLATTFSAARAVHQTNIDPPPGFPPKHKPQFQTTQPQDPPPGFASKSKSQFQAVLSQGPPPGFASKSKPQFKAADSPLGLPSKLMPASLSKGGTKKISSSATPKLGFELSTLGEEDGGQSFSGSPSPSHSPFHTPTRTPSPPVADLTSNRLNTPKLPGSAVKSRHLRINVLAEFRKRESTKEKINLVVVGHVDAGKSTLMGHLLFLLGNVSKKVMHKNEQESQKAGKSSFAYAWVLDETGEERHRGITMDIAQQVFETKTKSINLLDAPGHRDFIPNMITGAAQADVAVLVVNATVGEFEAGFESGGQTREHAILVRSLGVKQLAVAVNKLDTVHWSEVRFNEVVQKLRVFLKQAGYKESDVKYVPCSGLVGENLITPSSVKEFKQWYSGPTLLDIIDQFIPPARPVERPFRCCIGDIFKGQSSGVSIAGRVDSGHVQVGETVLILPAQEVGTIKSILASSQEDVSSWVVAGDQAIFNISGVDVNKIGIGSILCSTLHPIQVTTRFEARIIVFNIELPITIGYPVVLHCQSMNEPAVIKKLISLLSKTTGELIKKRPRCLMKNSTGMVRIEVLHPVCVELYSDCRELGRFMLRSSGHTIAAGVITKILL